MTKPSKDIIQEFIVDMNLNLKNSNRHSAFKIIYPKVTNELTSTIVVIDFENKKHADFNAIWDTGATHSVITKNVVERLNLKPTGIITMFGVNNQSEKPTYVINLILPNEVLLPNLNVAEANLFSSNIDLLIGMDVISKGDLAISNHEKTIFCFSLPPHPQHIDLVARADEANTSLNGVS